MHHARPFCRDNGRYDEQSSTGGGKPVKGGGGGGGMTLAGIVPLHAGNRHQIDEHI